MERGTHAVPSGRRLAGLLIVLLSLSLFASGAAAADFTVDASDTANPDQISSVLLPVTHSFGDSSVTRSYDAAENQVVFDIDTSLPCNYPDEGFANVYIDSDNDGTVDFQIENTVCTATETGLWAYDGSSWSSVWNEPRNGSLTALEDNYGIEVDTQDMIIEIPVSGFPYTTGSSFKYSVHTSNLDDTHNYGSGDASWDKTNSSGFSTVHAEPAGDGDTITVHDGTYAGFMLRKNLTVTAASGASPVIDVDEGTATSGRVIGIRDSGGDPDGATVSGLTVDATGQSSYKVGVSVSADQVTIANMTIQGDSMVTGIQTQTGYDGPGSEGTSITGNTINNANVGISLQGGADTAADNTVTGAILEGIGVAGDGHHLAGNDVSTTGGSPGMRFYGPISSVNGVATSELDQANELLTANPNTVSIAFKATGTTYDRSVQNADTGTYYPSIQAAIDDASAGDTIEVAAGTYTEQLNLQEKSLTIDGAGMGQTVIDASSFSGYAISNFGNHTTFKDAKLLGSDDYGFKVAHVSNITLENIRVEDSGKTGVDLNDVDTSSLSNIEVVDTVAGFGLMLLESTNINVSDVTTSGNAWGGVSVQLVNSDVGPISFSGTFDAQESIPLLLEQDPPYSGNFVNVDIPNKFGYVFYGLRTDYDYKQWHYTETAQDAKDLANSLMSSSTYEDKIIRDIAETTYHVIPNMQIQEALDAATAGDTVEVGAGTYGGAIRISTENITLDGGGGATIAPQTSAQMDPRNRIVDIEETGVTFIGFTVVGLGKSSDDIAVYTGNRGSNATITDNVVKEARGGITAGTGAEDATILRNNVSHTDEGITLLSHPQSVEDNRISQSNVGLKTFSGKYTISAFEPQGNTFEENDLQVNDSSGNFDIQQILDDNSFDTAVTIDRPGNSLLNTVWSNIQDAVDEAQDNDTLRVGPGTYGAVTFDSLQNVTLTSTGDASNTIIDASGNGVGVQVHVKAGGVTVEGFTIKNADSFGIGYWNDVDGQPDHANFAIRNNILEDNGADGIGFGGSVNVTVSGNTFVNNGQNAPNPNNGNGILAMSLQHATIRDNVFDGNADASIYLDNLTGSGYMANKDVVVRRNKFVNMPYGINNTAGLTVDARRNYWGHASGPTRTSGNKTLGKGAKVSGKVTFTPWYPTAAMQAGTTGKTVEQGKPAKVSVSSGGGDDGGDSGEDDPETTNITVKINASGTASATAEQVTAPPQNATPPKNRGAFGGGVNVTVTNGTHNVNASGTVIIRYSQSFADSVENERTIRIYYYNETVPEWQPVPGTRVFPSNNTVQVPVSHFSMYAAYGQPDQGGTAELSDADISVSPGTPDDTGTEPAPDDTGGDTTPDDTGPDTGEQPDTGEEPEQPDGTGDGPATAPGPTGLIGTASAGILGIVLLLLVVAALQYTGRVDVRTWLPR